jgi:outer membrane protein assembly factor BamA
VYRNVFSNSLSVGVRYDFQKSDVNPINQGLLDVGGYNGAHGSTQSSLGIGGRYDSRDYKLSATKGWYIDASGMWAEDWIGATYSDQFLVLDVRKYIPVSAKKDIIAVQVYSELHSGDVPFNLMSLLGGSERMRGYREGIYRDKQMLVYQLEYRSRIYFKYFAFALFANMGGIGNDFQEVNANYRYTVGGGLRYTPMPKERMFFRFDYAVGDHSQGFYIALGEAF